MNLHIQLFIIMVVAVATGSAQYYQPKQTDSSNGNSWPLYNAFSVPQSQRRHQSFPGRGAPLSDYTKQWQHPPQWQRPSPPQHSPSVAPPLLFEPTSQPGLGTPVSLFKPCTEKPLNGQLFNLSVDPCFGQGYCTLKRGTTSTLEFQFISFYPSETLHGKLSGIFGWISVPFGSAEDLCQYPGISCPIKPGQVYKVRKLIPVSTDFPSLELDTKLQIYGDKKGDIGCTLIPVKII